MTVTKCDICGKEGDHVKDRFGMIQFLRQGPDLDYDDVCNDCYKELMSVVRGKVKELKEG